VTLSSVAVTQQFFREYAAIEKWDRKHQRNSVKMWAGFYWFSTGLISELL